VVGEHNQADPSDGQIAIGVQSILLHEQYNNAAGHLSNDLALLLLDSQLPCGNPNLSPVCLPESLTDVTNIDAWVTGWGRTDEDVPQISPTLQEIFVPVYTHEQCYNLFTNPRAHLSEYQICAGREGMDACIGDSGGPLFANAASNDFQYVQLGIVSFGYGCDEPNLRGVYTNVAAYRSWIEERTSSPQFVSI